MQNLQLIIAVILLIAAVFIRTGSIWWNRVFPLMVLASVFEVIASRIDHDHFDQGFYSALVIIGVAFVARDWKIHVAAWRRHD